MVAPGRSPRTWSGETDRTLSLPRHQPAGTHARAGGAGRSTTPPWARWPWPNPGWSASWSPHAHDRRKTQEGLVNDGGARARLAAGRQHRTRRPVRPCTTSTCMCSVAAGWAGRPAEHDPARPRGCRGRAGRSGAEVSAAGDARVRAIIRQARRRPAAAGSARTRPPAPRCPDAGETAAAPSRRPHKPSAHQPSTPARHRPKTTSGRRSSSSGSSPKHQLLQRNADSTRSEIPTAWSIGQRPGQLHVEPVGEQGAGRAEQGEGAEQGADQRGQPPPAAADQERQRPGHRRRGAGCRSAAAPPTAGSATGSRPRDSQVAGPVVAGGDRAGQGCRRRRPGRRAGSARRRASRDSTRGAGFAEWRCRKRGRWWGRTGRGCSRRLPS